MICWLLLFAAHQVPDVANEVIDSGKVQSVILIPGGMGETKDGQETEARLRRRIAESRTAQPDGGPVFHRGGIAWGFNRVRGITIQCLFPRLNYPKRWEASGKKVAVISQSGAYVITRMSNLEILDPEYAISTGKPDRPDYLRYCSLSRCGKQISKFSQSTSRVFRDLDGLALSRAVAKAVARGKDVVFYKAGRTEAGRAATAGTYRFNRR